PLPIPSEGLPRGLGGLRSGPGRGPRSPRSRGGPPGGGLLLPVERVRPGGAAAQAVAAARGDAASVGAGPHLPVDDLPEAGTQAGGPALPGAGHDGRGRRPGAPSRVRAKTLRRGDGGGIRTMDFGTPAATIRVAWQP